MCSCCSSLSQLSKNTILKAHLWQGLKSFCHWQTRPPSAKKLLREGDNRPKHLEKGHFITPPPPPLPSRLQWKEYCYTMICIRAYDKSKGHLSRKSTDNELRSHPQVLTSDVTIRINASHLIPKLSSFCWKLDVVDDQTLRGFNRSILSS